MPTVEAPRHHRLHIGMSPEQRLMSADTRSAAMGELSAALAQQCHNNIVTSSDTSSMGSSDHAEKKYLLQLI